MLRSLLVIAIHFTRENGIRSVANLKYAGLLLVMSCGLFSRAQVPPSTAPNSSLFRHIVVVDTSFSMVRRRQALYDAVSDIFEGGLSGHIREGETVEMWTFNENVDAASIPPRPWRRAEARGLAARAVNYLKNRRFAKRTRMAGLMAKIVDASKSAEQFTVVLLSDGDTDVVGTPYDRSVNLAYRDYGRAVRRARQTFVTILRGREGEFRAWAVIRGGDRIQVPILPEPRREIVARLKNPLIRTNALPLTESAKSLPIELNSGQITKPGLEAEKDETSQIAVRSQSSLEKLDEIGATEEKIEEIHSDPPEAQNPAGMGSTDLNLSPPRTVLQNNQNSAELASSNDESRDSKLVQDSGIVELNEISDEMNATESVSLGGGSVLNASEIETPKQEDTAKPIEMSNKRRIDSSEQTALPEPTVEALTESENSRVGISSSATLDTHSREQEQPRPLASVSPGAPSNSKWYLVFGVTLLVLAVSLLVWTIRSGGNKRQPSIISRSMDHLEK